MNRLLPPLRWLLGRFDDSLRFRFLPRAGPVWRAWLPEACLSAGILLALTLATWLGFTWSWLSYWLATSAYNALAFVAVWLLMAPPCVVTTVYAVKLAHRLLAARG